jgi:hypothetical protein
LELEREVVEFKVKFVEIMRIKTILFERYRSYLTTPHLMVCGHPGNNRIGLLLSLQVSRHLLASPGTMRIEADCRMLAGLYKLLLLQGLDDVELNTYHLGNLEYRMHEINPNYRIGYVEFHLEHTNLLREASRLLDFSHDMNTYFIVNLSLFFLRKRK